MKLIRLFWRRLSTPSKAAAGALLGMGFVGGILFWGAFNTGMEATNTEAFCSSCHAPIVAEIRETIHYANRSGVRAICSDCHVPHEWTDKIVRKVVATKDFGAFVEIVPGTDGMCHISELADGYVKSVTDVVKVGDVVKVKVIDVDEGTGKIRLSRRAVMAEESPAEPVEAS